MMYQGKSEGFTLLELLLLLMLAGIIYISASPFLRIDESGIQNAALVVASDISRTQLDAMAKGRKLNLSFASGSCIYLYGDGATRDLSEFGSGTVISSGGPVEFNSLGEPVGATSPITLRLSSGSSSRSLTIEPYTGKVTVQ